MGPAKVGVVAPRRNEVRSLLSFGRQGGIPAIGRVDDQRGALRSYALQGSGLDAAASRAIDRGFDKQAAKAERPFFYLPYMHSETLADQERCCELCRAAGDKGTLEYAELHADIIRRFGRFPHRNAVLGRVTTPQEQAFLDEGGFAG